MFISYQKAGAMARKHGAQLPDTGETLELPVGSLTKRKVGFGFSAKTVYEFKPC